MTDKVGDKAGDKAANKLGHKPANKLGHKPANKLGHKPANKVGHKPGRNSPSRAAAQPPPPLKAAADSHSAERVFAALANGSRREILTLLHAHHGPMTSGEIAGRFESSWQTISRHLKVLEEAGLISFERRGRDRAYEMETSRLQAVAGQWLMRFTATDRSAAEAAGARE